MKKVLTVMVATVILVAGASISAQAQAPVKAAAGGAVKIGFINSQRVVMESDKGKAVINTLQAEANNAKVRLDGKEKELKSLQAAYMDNKDKWDAATRQAKKEEFEQKEKAYKRDAEDFLEYYDKRENEKLKPIFDSFRQVIQNIGKTEGYTVIFDVSGQIVYLDPSADITDKLIKSFNLKK